MARKPKSAQADEHDQQSEGGVALLNTPASESENQDQQDQQSQEQEPSIPPRASNELLPNVINAGATITGCTESEVKNYLATADFVCRQVGMLLADKWLKICKTARAVGAENEKSAKVPVAVKIDIDHTNILLMDTRVSLSFAEKHHAQAETQEDLTQTEFNLKQ
jgi:hypothetical protein